jgi:NAD(P)-dependent dehydrogenase (short-subunit alcohol dehydrogenase family)
MSVEEDLAGKVVVSTGSGCGIGKEKMISAAANGAQVEGWD